MNIYLQRVLDYLKKTDPQSNQSLTGAVQNCIKEGFQIGLIIAGISKHYEIPHEEAKRFVVSSPKLKGEVKELNDFHDEIEKVLIEQKEEK